MFEANGILPIEVIVLRFSDRKRFDISLIPLSQC